jgi:hypothetical protein
VRSAVPTYKVHGLRVRSAIGLGAAVTRSRTFDIDLQWGERHAVPDAVPNGRLLAHLGLPGASYSLTAGPAGYLLRVHGLCEFAVDHARRHARVHLASDVEEELASLFAGGFLAAMLSLGGHCVLHASAIEADGRAVAFIGSSGIGKTTVAALCCAAGARLVTDDVLRVELHDREGWCFSGSRELRLRPAAAELAELFAGYARRSTSDQRTAVRPAAAAPGTFPLAAVVMPGRADGARGLRIERLRGSEALLVLLRFPRSLGWTQAEKARRDFDVLASLAESVPVYRAELPSGPPFDGELGRRLLEEIGLDVTAPGARRTDALADDDRGSLACS